MKQVGKRLRALREGAMLSQVKMAEAIGSAQSSINRYENGQSTPPVSLFRAYADYFDVSMDYIFARTKKPQGRLYEYKPKITSDNEQLRQFIEMCFDPESPVSDKMKETLFQMMTGGDNK
jgi:transcriptional regulator with XRE-family HTH domain